MVQYLFKGNTKLAAIRSLLLGRSVLCGAIVAFEMAQQLQKQDCRVALLALFDPSDPAVLPRFVTKNMSFSKKVGHYVRKTVFYFKTNQFFYAFKRFVKLRRTPHDRRILNVMHSHQIAINNYVFQVYPGKITLFQSSEFRTLENGGHDRFNRWQPWRGHWSNLVTGGFVCHVIEGSHSEIFQEPKIQILVEKLKASLDETQQDVSNVHQKSDDTKII